LSGDKSKQKRRRKTRIRQKFLKQFAELAAIKTLKDAAQTVLNRFLKIFSS